MIVRFFSLEWLNNLSSRSGWQGYYSSLTPSCNHPISILTQSKRLPLVWDQLAAAVPAWQEMLLDTKDVKAIRDDTEQWIFKPALGRVGEGISIKGTMSPGEYRRILRAVKRKVFTVGGKCAGFYGRISHGARIDANAKEIPVLVEKDSYVAIANVGLITDPSDRSYSGG